MYRFFAFAFYLFPLVLFFVLSSDRTSFIYTNSIYLGLLGIFLYIVFPVVLITKSFYEVKRSSTTSIKDLLKAPTGFIAGLVKLFLSVTVISLALFFSFGIFIFSVNANFKDGIASFRHAYNNQTADSERLARVEDSLKNMLARHHTEKINEFFKVNKASYSFKDSTADYTISNFSNVPDAAGFDNKYHYLFKLCFSEATEAKIQKSYPDFYYTICPAISSEPGQKESENLIFAQDDVIKKFTVKPYEVPGFRLPVFLGTLELETRVVSFIAYPKYATESGNAYIFKGLPSATGSDFSDTCQLSYMYTGKIGFTCSHSFIYDDSDRSMNSTQEVQIYISQDGVLQVFEAVVQN